MRTVVDCQTRGDKSASLARGGYTINNADQLLHDLRTQPLLLDATPLHSTEFGPFYGIRGPLVGPNGVTLHIRSIWMNEHVSAAASLPTLTAAKYPLRRVDAHTAHAPR